MVSNYVMVVNYNSLNTPFIKEVIIIEGNYNSSIRAVVTVQVKTTLALQCTSVNCSISKT